MRARRRKLVLLSLALAFAASGCDSSGSADVLMAVYPNDTCFMAGSTLSGDTAERCCDMRRPESPYLENGIYNKSRAIRAYSQACEAANAGCQTTCEGEGGTMSCYDSACVGQCYDEGTRKADEEYSRLTAESSHPREPRNPYPASCPQPPGFTPAASTVSTFNSAAQAARTSLQSAEGLVGVRVGVSPGTSAATAADGALRAGSGNPSSADAINLIHKPGDPQAAGKSGKSGPGAGAAPGAASATLGGSLSTAPIPDHDSAGIRGAAAALADSGGSAYSRGGGGGGGARPAEKGAGLDDGEWASLMAGAMKGGNKPVKNGVAELKFGDSGASPQAGIAAQQDPLDYFDRLKPQDNLFKVVERRYRGKARELESGGIRRK